MKSKSLQRSHMSTVAFKLSSNITICSTDCLGHHQIKHCLKSALQALCEENPLVTSGFPSQRANNVEIVSMSRWHHLSSSNMKYIGWKAFIQCGAITTLSKSSHKTSHSSHVRAGYRVSLIGLTSDLYSASIPAVMYSILCDIWPCHNGTGLSFMIFCLLPLSLPHQFKFPLNS